MANTTTSTNMSLPIPVVGVDPGPEYATDTNSCLTIIDSHDHSSGSGVQITPSGININSDLSFNSSNLTSARSLRLSIQSAVLALAADINCLYDVSGDLYFNDGSGNHVRITQSGGVAGSPGSIANLTSPASATYVSGSTTFVWQSAASTAANLDAGSVIIRKLTASSSGITLSAPSALSSDYTLTLPGLPASQKFMTLDNSGNISAPWAVDGSTLEIATSTTLQVKDAGIVTAKLADSSVTTAKLADSSVSTAKIIDNAVTQAKRAVRTTGTTATAGNIAIANSSGGYTRTATSFATVTNQSISITTLGSPVRLDLVSDGNTGNNTYIGVTCDSTNAVGGFNWRIQRGGSTIASGQILIQTLNIGSSDEIRITPGISFMDPVAAGTYTYTFQIASQSTLFTAKINDCALMAYEL